MNLSLTNQFKKVYNISIIILNWNNWEDTIACVESVLKSDYCEYKIFLLDNSSTDDSVKKIESWLKYKFSDNRERDNHKKRFLIFEVKDISTNQIFDEYLSRDVRIIFIKNDKNDGFAKGTNIGISLAKKIYNPDYFFLLNNDTLVEKDTIRNLINTMNEFNISIGTSVIYYYGSKDKIQNAGGKLTFFARRKYYLNLNKKAFRFVTFATGCALMINNGVFSKYGFLSEKFFFGEEDFEFALRMKKFNVKMIVVNNSRVYHKVSASSKKFFQSDLRKVFLYGLNRLINMREYYSTFYWNIWRRILVIYFFYLFAMDEKTTLRKAFKLSNKLNNYGLNLNDIQKDKVERIYDEW